MPATTWTKVKATTTTPRKAKRVRCPDCAREGLPDYTPAQAAKNFFKNRASRTGHATWCKRHCRERDQRKREAKSAK